MKAGLKISWQGAMEIVLGDTGTIPLSIIMMSSPADCIFGLLPSRSEVSHFASQDVQSECLMFLLRSGSPWGSHAGFYVQLSSLMECKSAYFAPWPNYFCYRGRERQLCGCTFFFLPHVLFHVWRRCCTCYHELSMYDWIESQPQSVSGLGLKKYELNLVLCSWETIRSCCGVCSVILSLCNI